MILGKTYCVHHIDLVEKASVMEQREETIKEDGRGITEDALYIHADQGPAVLGKNDWHHNKLDCYYSATYDSDR